MGAVIKMVTTFPAPGHSSRKGALWLARKAAVNCLKESVTDPRDIDLVIYTGIYRDDHIGEPSIASLLQKGIGANLYLNPLDQRTFSFDLNAGACGMVKAMELAEGFMSSGQSKRALLIAADSEPVRGLSENYNFKAAASAIIMESTDNERLGLKEFHSYSYPEYKDSFKSFILWKNKKGRIRQRNILVVEEEVSYLQECVDCSIDSITQFLDIENLTLNEIDLIITSQSPVGFSKKLSDGLGLDGKVQEVSGTRNLEYHTAGPGYSLREAWENNSFNSSGNILFLTVGAGISTALALYRN